MSHYTLVAIVTAAILVILLAHEVSRLALRVFVTAVHRLPPALNDSAAWRRSQPLRSRLASRFPRCYRLAQARLQPRSFDGLPLTLLVLAAIYLAALLGGLVEDVIEAEEIVRFDAIINAALTPWRVEPLISVFIWITALGSSYAVTAGVMIATGFLWADRRSYLIMPLWITAFGSQATTWGGKFLLHRSRPLPTIDLSEHFPAFPSAHATAAIAVYGFLAYAFARDLAGPRQRFEVVFWIGVLIVLIGLSRLYLGVHFVSDVASGYLVGGFWLLIGFTIAEWTRPGTKKP
jgi:undecaprenyl-diphosphatase